QRVAVGCRPRRRRHGDVAAAARHVLDIERLADGFGELRGNEPRRGVALPARPGGDDHADRPARIGLRPRGARHRRDRARSCQGLQKRPANEWHVLTTRLVWSFPFGTGLAWAIKSQFAAPRKPAMTGKSRLPSVLSLCLIAAMAALFVAPA